MSNQYENNREWRPVAYNPGFIVEDWVALLQDTSIFTPESLHVLQCIKELGGIATCVELSNAYGKKPNFYNNTAWQLGKRIHKKTGCPLCEEKDYKYWPILFLGRHVNSKRLGTYEWKLRDELNIALDMLELNHQKKEAQTMPLSALAEAAKRHESKHPRSQEVTVRQISRSPYIKAYALQRSHGICQLCGNHAPFNDSDGNPYLEIHHVIWLSQGGSDSLDNVAALCPNCHRKMHIVQSQADVEKLKEAALALSSGYDVKADS